jgi:hypothetical protein
LLRQVYSSFQPPRADPRVLGSAKAIRAGEKACRGKTPRQVVERYLPESDLSAQQREALKQLPSAEEHPSADFVAGQLAALVYRGALASTLGEYSYRGCIYELAKGLKRQLR